MSFKNYLQVLLLFFWSYDNSKEIAAQFRNTHLRCVKIGYRESFSNESNCLKMCKRERERVSNILLPHHYNQKPNSHNVFNTKHSGKYKMVKQRQSLPHFSLLYRINLNHLLYFFSIYICRFYPEYVIYSSHKTLIKEILINIIRLLLKNTATKKCQQHRYTQLCNCLMFSWRTKHFLSCSFT